MLDLLGTVGAVLGPQNGNEQAERLPDCDEGVRCVAERRGKLLVTA